MRLFILSVAVVTAVVDGSFLRDVVGQKERPPADIQQLLLAKAIPLKEYKRRLASDGLQIGRELDQGGDDYAMDENDMYNFNGYSLNYGKCQPVQHFSEDAIAAGEYSPMVTEDVVIMRLCPAQSCSSKKKLGCSYNYADYAVGLSDYIRIMLNHQLQKEENLCEWCNDCYERRRLEDGAGENENNGDEAEDGNDNGQENNEDQQDNGEDQQENQNDNNQDENNQQDNGEGEGANDDQANDQAQQGDDANNNAAADDAYYNDDAYANDACYNYESYCVDEYGASVCDNDDGEGDDDYIDTEEYLDYVNCVEVEDYYVRPRCDGYDGTIKMALYYDKYCSQYSGNDASSYNVGVGFKDSVFESFYANSECIECSQSNNGPYYNSNSYMCNQIHANSAKCTTSMQYDLFGDDDEYASTSCSYIESLQYGNYDEKGELYTTSNTDASRVVTSGQSASLVSLLVVCVTLAVYSCYLHHAITNLLIKSLSHTDLLPPSRTNRAGRQQRSRSRSSRKKRVAAASAASTDDDEDWDRSSKQRNPA